MGLDIDEGGGIVRATIVGLGGVIVIRIVGDSERFEVRVANQV